MSKINIYFNNQNYLVDEQSLSTSSDNLKTHLQTKMNGTGATINLGGVSYNVDSTKLSTATNDFVAHLGTIAGDGCKVKVGNTEYSIDSTKLESAVSGILGALEEMKSEDEGGHGTEAVAGLYQSGAINLYNTEGVTAVDGMLISSWEKLIAEGLIVQDGNVLVKGSSAIDGDLIFPNEITSVGAEAFNECTLLKGVSSPFVTTVDGKAFRRCDTLTKVDFANLTTTGSNAFEGCYALQEINFHNLTDAGTKSFASCTALADVTMPNAINIYDYAFDACTALKKVCLPSATTVGSCAFQWCSALEEIDFPSLTTIGQMPFQFSGALKTVILRSESFCTSYGLASFRTSKPYFYVPKALVEQYATDEKWLSNTDAEHFRALEDYTVDGTTTGEIDPNKI